MRRLLLFFVFLLIANSLLSAQDTIRTLVITEARMDRAHHAFVELTNMGTEAINLSDFEFGNINYWDDPWDGVGDDRWMMLPDFELAPGESYVIAAFMDHHPEQYAIEKAKFGYSPRWAEYITKLEMWKIANQQIHLSESLTGDPTDSVSDNSMTVYVWFGSNCWYLRHHISDTDSAVIDQVGGVFDINGRNSRYGSYDVAGVEGATDNSILVRKFSVKEGNLDFANARGTDLAESEWIPLPCLRGHWEPEAAVFWTLGNHGDYHYSDLVSTTATINYTDSSITVPWGIRNYDSIMYLFNRIPGIAWHYSFHSDTGNVSQSHEDFSYVSCRSGDIFTLYACGNRLEQIDLKVVVTPPLVSDNILIPKYAHQPNGDYRGAIIPYKVSNEIPGMDTISEVPFATRTDTLLKYLEKAPNASWEFIWVDGEKRPDLKEGDILRVTAEDGISVKDYYIKVQEYRKSRNARLGAITWPDMPAYLYNLYGWNGDTIPNFTAGAHNYKVQLPSDMLRVPALVGILEDENAVVEVERAVHLDGGVAHRTVVFTVTAEDDTSTLSYNVLLQKEADPDVPIQPWFGDPFISEVGFWEQWSNGFVEIVNPGNQPLDLSNYMFYGGWGQTPAEAITGDAEATGDAWMNRFRKYIPGYKWASDSATWKADPAIAVKDLAVTSFLAPGDVFVMGAIFGTGQSRSTYGSDPNNWPSYAACDVVFNYPDTLYETWNEPMNGIECCNWTGAQYYLFKILNDSIKAGTKAATDPDDFELLDVFGHGDGRAWTIGGKQIDMVTSCRRKPQFYDGALAFGESFAGATPEDDSCEWILEDRPFYQALNTPWPFDILYVSNSNLGHHFMSDVTALKSTVTSIYYKVSGGFTMNESITGVITGTTADEFIANILKVDEGQVLTIMGADTLTGDDVVADGDSLIVVSANAANTSQYKLTVADEGLSNDALLVSDVYEIAVTGETGTVSGIDIDATLQEVLWNLDVPDGAILTPVDENDGFVPLQVRNLDTSYVEVTATDKIYLEVIAEDFVTTIVYQLLPAVLASDAFVTSDLFMVDQDQAFIELIPGGVSVEALLANLNPATGATMKVFNKLGLERTEGQIYKDDVLEVTAADGTTQKYYFFGMLQRDDEILPLYLAYVLSDVYAVDQFGFTIDVGLAASDAQVGILLFGLSPAPDAEMVLQSSDGTEKAITDNLAKGDVVVVTAGDGVTIAVYELVFDLTSREDLEDIALNAYPNPSSGTFTIEGLEAGQRVRIFNSLGANILDVPVLQTQEEISLEGQPNGIYFVSVSKED